jgi:hypothetical protein
MKVSAQCPLVSGKQPVAAETRGTKNSTRERVITRLIESKRIMAAFPKLRFFMVCSPFDICVFGM